MTCIEKRGSKYRARITLKGHPRLLETFNTKREATRWAERTTEALRKRRFKPETEAGVFYCSSASLRRFRFR